MFPTLIIFCVLIIIIALTCMFKEKYPFLFLNTSPLSPPGFATGICVQSTQAATPGNPATSENLRIFCLCSFLFAGNRTNWFKSSANSTETLCTIMLTDCWLTPLKSPETV